MAGESLITITDEEREWVRQESKFKRELDYQCDMAEARQEGRVEGLERGREEGARETARSFKLAGASLELIAQSTGLTQEEIAGL